MNYNAPSCRSPNYECNVNLRDTDHPWPHSTLKASQRLSPDFHATLEIARPLLQKLKEWYAHSPVSVRQPDHLPTTMDSIYCQSNCLRFACILLEVFVFRALLRPMVRSAAPPPLLEESFETTEFTNQFNDLLAQLFDADEIEPSMAIDMSDENGMGNAVLRAADNCAAKVIRLVMRMTTSDLSSFWYRCMFCQLEPRLWMSHTFSWRYTD